MKTGLQTLVIPMFNETKGNELVSFPLLDVGDSQFILKDVELYQKLSHALGSWLYNNSKIKTKDDYFEHSIKLFKNQAKAFSLTD
jgi:hypothetical protein